MATNRNITQITAPRVDLIDPQTGLMSREWYRFFYNIYVLVGDGTGITAVINGGTGLGTIPTNGQLLIGNGTGYTLNTLGFGAGISVTNGSGTISVANTGVLSFSAGTTGLTPATATAGAVTLAGKLVIANGGTNATVTPTAGAIAYGTGTAYAFTAAGTTGQTLISAGAGTPTWATPVVNTVSAPVTKTANFTVVDGEAWLINNKSGSTCTVTLPAAASWIGRQLIFKNMQAQTLVSASSNVVPLDSTVAGTAILLDVVGNWATMVSDGTNWVIMQAAANNNLLLE
jgi:hypothetical protein